jgi:F-type H+-transporting ATPase subunit epsilon
MEYTKEGVKHYFALGGGILDVQKDHVLILADSFESKEEIDRERALEAKQRAEELLKKAKENPLSSNVDIKRANLALKRAMNRLTLLDN